MSLMDMLMSRPGPEDRLQMVSGLMDLSQGSAPDAPMSMRNAGGVEGMAQDFFLRKGVSPEDWRKVDEIITQESHWNPGAVNESSGAAGLAQNINGYAPNYSRNDPMEQIRWLYNYLQNHNYTGYGTGIDAAYQHKQATGWY